MSFDPTPEKAAITARAKSLVGGRVYRGIVDDAILSKDSSGAVKPYICIYFGSLYPTYEDRSIMDETMQPQIMPVTFEAWAPTQEIADDVAAAIGNLFLSWQHDGNMTPMRFAGGGTSARVDSAGKPSRFSSYTIFETRINQDVTIP